MDPICPVHPRTDLTCEDPITGPPQPETSDVDRETRAIAEAHYEALASGVVTKPRNCLEFDDGQAHDFDRCITEAVSSSALFLRESGDADDVVSTDILQNKIGDCALMATLAALANTPEGRALIKGAIVENKNDKRQVLSYTVTLHRPETHALWFTTFSDVKVTVDPLFAVGHARLGSEGGTHEIWPAVMEKAFAQYMGGYNVLHQGSHADVLMALLTGNLAKSVAPQDYSPKQLKTDLAAGKLVVLETKRGDYSGNPFGLHQMHAYSVTGTTMANGELNMTLHNPWGSAQRPIPWTALDRWFGQVNVGRVK